ncbi:MAG: lipid-transfer protein [Proteobacteria bacterium]|nr:lipid-transfer protein [Pseudomonadota bacterium]
MFKDRTAIVGIGQTRFAKSLPESELALACQAVQMALEDAGLKPSDVDALGCYTYEQTPEFELARNLGFGPLHSFSQAPYGGGAACGAIGQVAVAIAAGIANVGVVWRSRKRSAPGTRMWAGVQERITDHWKWSRPSGLLRPADEVAMLMRRYMYEHAVSREHLSQVALVQREYANRNPVAFMHERSLTQQEYMAARMISDPLCLYDNCLETDGAVAVVIVRADRAREAPRPPAFIHAFSQGMSQQHQVMADYHGADPLVSSSYVTAANLWRQSDCGPQDVDVAQFYDAFSPLVLFSLEAYGFCPRGTAAAFVADGGTRLGGRLPVNTAGGSLSEVYLHGMNLVVEAVRQVRGTSTAQVPGTEFSLVTSCDSTPNGALILRGK